MLTPCPLRLTLDPLGLDPGILLAFALLHSVLQGQIHLLLQVFLDFLLLHSSPYNEKDIFFGVSSKWSLGLHRPIQLQLLQHSWLGHRLGLL